MKNLLVSSTNRAATKAHRPTASAGCADLLETHRRRGEDNDRRADLAAARQSDDDAEQLLAQFCEQSKSKHLNDYERRKK